jgi:predicted DsbA family dithiol-disulfide isomerase
MRVTYYVEIFSSWCLWAEPAWAELQAKYAGRVAFDWKIALMNADDFPETPEQCAWFYRRSGTVMQSPFMLSPHWVESGPRERYITPNLVAEAARELGATGDEVRLALSHAAMREGRKVARIEEAVAVAAAAGKLDPKALRELAGSAKVKDRVAASTAEFHAHRINQRPAFLLEDAIGDKAVISGLVAAGPLAATIDAMLADTAAYVSYAAHHGKPPSG